VQHITDEQRRHRLGVRHGLAPEHRHPDLAAATRAMTVLHATEAASVALALWARTVDVQVADVDRALHDDRVLVKQTAMRRTIFAFPRDLLPAAWGSASARAATQTAKEVSRFLTSAGISADPEAWIATTAAAVLEALADGTPRTTAQIRESVPALAARFEMGGPDKSWGGSYPIGTWVVGMLGAQGKIIRAANGGHWRLNKPTWTLTGAWLGESPAPWPEAKGYAELVRRWLWTFGPGTEADIVWWLGATKTAVRRALADLGVEQVGLDRGETGWVLPGDTETVPAPGPWAALLPALDPTVMGWRGREFYLDARDRPYLFDTAGNATSTAWWDGRIVGSWIQDDDAVVQVILREDVGADAATALDAEAARLTAWLGGVRIPDVYATRVRSSRPLQ
jgi:hypothetical protein